MSKPLVYSHKQGDLCELLRKTNFDIVRKSFYERLHWLRRMRGIRPSWISGIVEDPAVNE